MDRRSIALEDLLKIRFPHDAALSPDGGRVLYVLARLDESSNEFRGNLWITSTIGTPPRPFTADEGRDTSPVWAPDGRWVAFLSNRGARRMGRKKAAMQLWVMPVDGGEARQLTFFKAGVAQPGWSPDGRHLTFVSRGSLDRRETKADDEELIVREITRPKYKFDAMGFLEGFAHIWIVPAVGGEPTRLTDGDYDHDTPAYLPGGREVVFIANRTRDADFSFARDVWAVEVETGRLRQITHNAGPCTSAVPSPDGRLIAFVGHDFHVKTATNLNVWVVPSAGGEARNVTASLDRSIGNAVGSDARLAPLVPQIAWTADGSAVVFNATDKGRSHVYRVGVVDAGVQQITDGVEVIADLTAAAGWIVYQRMNPTSMDELWVLPPGGESRRLVAPNDDLLATLYVNDPQHFTYAGVDGWPMDGWLLTPPGFDASKKYPAILRIHGGPHSAYGDTFNHYVHFLAAQGYVVVWTNPRGSQGYGEAFTKAVVGDWGGKDSRDILMGLDAAIAKGFIDPERVAVTGGSYGGFMTNWLITHTSRFRCAITEVCVSNLYSFWGTSDIGSTWGEIEWGANPWDDPDRLLMQSPLAFVRNVTTPVLVTANEEDHRCPIEQSEQFYIALRKLGKTTAFLRFTESSHTMASNGKPKQRLERMRRLLTWFNKYLQPAAEPAVVPGS